MAVPTADADIISSNAEPKPTVTCPAPKARSKEKRGPTIDWGLMETHAEGLLPLFGTGGDVETLGNNVQNLQIPTLVGAAAQAAQAVNDFGGKQTNLGLSVKQLGVLSVVTLFMSVSLHYCLTPDSHIYQIPAEWIQTETTTTGKSGECPPPTAVPNCPK